MSLTEAIKNRFGSKKGLLRYIAYESLRSLGFYREFGEIDFARVKRLVFVCHGNICRSPLGEAVARQHGVATFSFGLDTRGDDAADPRAIKWAQNNGFDLKKHVTQPVAQYAPAEGDLLIGMEPKHVRQLKALFFRDGVQITLMGLWSSPAFAYLHDPYNTNDHFFSACERAVVDSTLSLLRAMNAAVM